MVTYEEAFANIRGLMPTDNNSLGDALTHEFIMYKLGYPSDSDFVRTSFRAVSAHIRTEMGGNVANNSYTRVFGKYNFCRRILQGWPI